ncbi:hypothetical protein llg_08580 [Luteolibacter sp. LG18]|nr:hypothetical protein llg_08580 [Luteolibacter sp. LG18]
MACAAAAVLPLIACSTASGASYWVDGVLDAPPTYLGNPDPVTDQTNSTGWSGVELDEGQTLTLTWSTAFFDDGTGQIIVNSTLRVFPDPAGSGFDVRLLLSDGSYTDTLTLDDAGGVKVLDTQAKKYVARQTFDINDLYTGPLAIKGIEFTNLNPSDVDGSTVHDPFSLLSVYATVPAEPVPEPSGSLLALGGAALLLGRRRRTC